MKTKEIKNYKMSDSVYKLRRKVIQIIYDLKHSNINLPRINVRIGESTCGHENVLGVGGSHNIWITEKAINRGDTYLWHVVLHEIGHAVFNLQHDSNCPLMAAVLNSPCSKVQAFKILKKYSIDEGSGKILSMKALIPA